jgi:hypothetical protein
MSEDNADWNETTRTMTKIIQDEVPDGFYQGRWPKTGPFWKGEQSWASATYRIVATCYIASDLSSATLTITDEALFLLGPTAKATFVYSGSLALDEESGLIIGWDLSLSSYSIDDAGILIGEEPGELITFAATSEEWESGAYAELES